MVWYIRHRMLISHHAVTCCAPRPSRPARATWRFHSTAQTRFSTYCWVRKGYRTLWSLYFLRLQSAIKLAAKGRRRGWRRPMRFTGTIGFPCALW